MPNALPVSIQLYSLRDLPSLEVILDAVVSTGYTRVELTGGHVEDADKVRSALAKRGLKASSAHVGMDQLRGDLPRLLEGCAALDVTDIYMPAVPFEDRRMKGVGWSALGVELAGLADRCAVAGVQLGYHNHDWDVMPVQGTQTGLDLIFEAAGTAPLIWQADLAWIVRAGGDPVEWLGRFGGRLRSVHVKDVAPAGENSDEDGWACPGDGIMNWPDLWQTCLAAGAATMIMEHDLPKDPATFAARAMAFARQIGAVS